MLYESPSAKGAISGTLDGIITLIAINIMKTPNTILMVFALFSSQILWKCDSNHGPGFSGFGSYISAIQSVVNKTMPIINDAVSLIALNDQRTVVIKNATATMW